MKLPLAGQRSRARARDRTRRHRGCGASIRVRELPPEVSQKSSQTRCPTTASIFRHRNASSSSARSSVSRQSARGRRRTEDQHRDALAQNERIRNLTFQLNGAPTPAFGIEPAKIVAGFRMATRPFIVKERVSRRTSGQDAVSHSNGAILRHIRAAPLLDCCLPQITTMDTEGRTATQRSIPLRAQQPPPRRVPVGVLQEEATGAPQFAQLLRRIQNEYREMPGLKLTEAQARRLWDLDVSTCSVVLTTLLQRRFLKRTASGTYVSGIRLGTGEQICQEGIHGTRVSRTRRFKTCSTETNREFLPAMP